MKRYHDTLIEILKDPTEAAEYLDTVLAEGDLHMFLVALRNVAEARGGMRQLSRNTKLNRAHLHKMLSEHGNPEIQTLVHLLNSLGMRLAIAQKDISSKKTAPKLPRAA